MRVKLTIIINFTMPQDKQLTPLAQKILDYNNFGTRDIEYEGINFRKTDLLTSMLSDVVELIRKSEPRRFDHRRIFWETGMGSYVIAYDKKEVRDKDARFFEKNINILSDKFQSPQLSAEFEYGDLYCVYVRAERALTGQSNEYSYRGVIFNPEKFVQKNAGNETRDKFLAILKDR